MRARTLLPVFLALVLAGGTTMLARAWLQAQRDTISAAPAAEAPPMPTRSVLVAKAPIAAGHLMKPEDLGWQLWPDGAVDPSYILSGTKKPEDFTGWVARGPLLAGEPIAEGRIVAPGDRGFLAAMLNRGMRAVSVAVTPTSGISGFVFPGDRVDLLLTHVVPQVQDTSTNPSGAAFERRATETVLTDLRVLAIDQKLESRSGEAIIAHTATLEVTPKQSETVAVAEEMGKLSLSLRGLAVADEAPADIVDQRPGAPLLGHPALNTPPVVDLRSARPLPVAPPAVALALTGGFAGKSTVPDAPNSLNTFTLDNQASRLLPPMMMTHSGPPPTVTVMHGSKADELTLSRGR